MGTWLNANGLFKDSATYYTQLNTYLHTSGSRYRNDVKWKDKNCDSTTKWATCTSSNGIIAAKMSATIAQTHTATGIDRYNTMVALRQGVAAAISNAFPYNPAWLYWEEAGAIGPELTRNLLIAGGAVIVMVAMLIPHPRVSICVIVSILMATTSIVGFMHWWGTTISGVSSIYIIISIGLAVDYSAHIGHMFAASTGTAAERACKSLERIGPSVLNAIISTLLAVIVLSASKSYIFRTFFKVLCLTVLIGGAHGIWFLPALLSLIGGDNNDENRVSPASTPREGKVGDETEPCIVTCVDPGDEPKAEMELGDVV